MVKRAHLVFLVQKYQKRIHALVWQKIGDYHIAEDITQEAFLKAYNKLATLKNHKQFDGWVICYSESALH